MCQEGVPDTAVEELEGNCMSRTHELLASLGSLLIAVITTLLLLGGCPPEQWKTVKFIVDGEKKDELRIGASDAEVILKLHGVTTISSNFLFRLYIEANYPSVPYGLEYKPNEIHVLVDDVEMNDDPAGETYHADTTATKEYISRTPYLIFSEFSCDPALVIKYDDKGKRMPASIRIVLGEILSVKGNTLPFDTIYALEF